MADESARIVSPRVGILVGLAAGLASGLLGIGGGLVVVPLLSAWLHVPIKRAIGTSLFAVVVTSAVGVATELVVAPANLRWGAALVLASTAIAGSWAGARLVAATRPGRLALLMAGVLVIAALRMSRLLELVLHRPTTAPFVDGGIVVLAHAIVGSLAGVIGAMFGIGGGILAVPALAWIHPDWPFQACRATSLVMIVPTSIAAALLHKRLAHVDFGIARALVPGSIVGSIAGVLLANRVPGRPLEIAFSALLIVSAVQIANRAPKE